MTSEFLNKTNYPNFIKLFESSLDGKISYEILETSVELPSVFTICLAFRETALKETSFSQFMESLVSLGLPLVIGSMKTNGCF